MKTHCIHGHELTPANRMPNGKGCRECNRLKSAKDYAEHTEERKTQMRERSRTHKRSSEYRTWAGMIQRCTNPNVKCWEDYGGRGICVCTRWRDSFAAFLEDLGLRPKGKSLDRINNSGHYVPSNVRWATRKQQQNNRRKRGIQNIVIPFVDVA
jgi:hypothetical protein